MLIKYLRVILFLCVLLWGTSVVDAQTKGIVVDGVKGRSLSDVNIYLQKDSVGIGSTDRNGEFMFNRDQITISDTIVFSHVGYFPLKCTLSELQHLGYKVVLHEHPQLLHEVVVSGERPPFFLEWTSLSPLPKPLYSFGGFLHAGKIYVVAGDETLVRMVTDKHRRSTSLLSFTMTACMRWEEL